MSELPNAASVALVRLGEVLIIQRARAPWAGMWSLPGGRLEAGEDAETCARRELMEELSVAVGRLVPVTLLRTGEAGRFLLQVFATTSFAGEIAASDEIAAWRWIAPGSINAYETTPHLADVIGTAFRALDAG
jgi:8-oxo-dGTP diphosphatase